MPERTPYRLTYESPQIPAILALLRESFAYMEKRIDPPSSLHRLTTEKIRVQAEQNEVWAIGTPPSACVFLKERAKSLYIEKLAVATDCQGFGLARKLVDLAAHRARQKAISCLELEARIELTENHAIFARLGFIKIREAAHSGYVHPTYIVMRKSVET